MQRSRQSGSYDKKQEEELEARLAVEKRQLREQSIQQRRLLQAQTQHEMCQKQQQAQSSSSRQQRQQNNVRHKTIRGHEMFGTGNSLSLIRAAMNYAEPQHDFDALFPDLNSAGGLVAPRSGEINDRPTNAAADLSKSRLRRYLDYVAGTSTGGLSAIMLSRMKMSIHDALELYSRVGNDVFGKPRFGYRDPKLATKRHLMYKSNRQDSTEILLSQNEEGGCAKNGTDGEDYDTADSGGSKPDYYHPPLLRDSNGKLVSSRDGLSNMSHWAGHQLRALQSAAAPSEAVEEKRYWKHTITSEKKGISETRLLVNALHLERQVIRDDQCLAHAFRL